MTESRRKAVAIIGAGVRDGRRQNLVELGYENASEKLDGIGGTWHEKKSTRSRQPRADEEFVISRFRPRRLDENKPSRGKTRRLPRT